MEWISVEDRLPEIPIDCSYSDDVLIVFDNKKMLTAQLKFDYEELDVVWCENEGDGEDYAFKPTHWMPLPSPPK